MTGPREHHLVVERTARYWVLGDADASDVWFVLHGYKQLARRFLRRFRPIEAPDRLIIAPEGLSRFYVSTERGRHGADSIVGASWMTREDRTVEIADYVSYLDRLARHVGVPTDDGSSPSGAGRRLTVLGFSQGVATASRWVVGGSVKPHRLILWGDFLPPDLDMERARAPFRTLELMLVRGSDDPALAPELAREEMGRLAAADIAHRSVTYDGGHDIDAATLRALTEEG